MIEKEETMQMLDAMAILRMGSTNTAVWYVVDKNPKLRVTLVDNSFSLMADSKEMGVFTGFKLLDTMGQLRPDLAALIADPDLVENYKNNKTKTHKFGFF